MMQRILIAAMMALLVCGVTLLASEARVSGCPGDTNGNNTVDVDDLLTVIANFGESGGGAAHGDVNGDGHTDMADLLVVLSHFENCANTAAPAWKGSPLRYLAMEPVTGAPSTVEGHSVKVYRLMAHMDAGTRLDAVYAAGAAHLSIGPGAGLEFYHNAFGGSTSSDINHKLFDSFPAVEWDSYVTINALYSHDNTLSSIGVDWATWSAPGHALTAEDGGWFVTPDETQSLESGGKICLGQFTVINGSGVGHHDVIGAINVHGRDADGHYWSRENVGWVVHDVCPSGCTYTSVQTALNASSDGDVVVVGAGTYHEHFINPGGHAVTVIGQPADDFLSFTSVLSRLGGGPVMVFENNETSATIFRDVVIEGGNAVNGGGITLDGANPTFQHCLITHNHAAANGGGMYNRGGGRPTLNNCLFENNVAGGIGGGIYNDGASPVMNHTVVSHNSAASGGGIASATTTTRGDTEEASNPTLHNCIVCGNSDGQLVGAAIHSGENHIHLECNLGNDPGDLDGDGDVDVDDLNLHHAAVGICQSDVNHDGVTDINDILEVIAGWNSVCP